VTTFVASATTFETISGASPSAMPYDSQSVKPTSRTARYATETSADERRIATLRSWRSGDRPIAIPHEAAATASTVVGFTGPPGRRDGGRAAGQSLRSPRSTSAP
jgi:hypothetical protein